MSLTLNADKTSSRWGRYGLTRVGHHRINKSLYDAVMKAAELAEWGPVIFLQGGINAGAVSASASTHAGLDVADIRTRGHSRKQIFRFCTKLMECGAIGFIRGVVDKMDPHMHIVSVPADQAHRSAWLQIYSRTYGYKYGGAGLGGAPRARWWGPPRKPLVTWEKSRHNPVNKPKPITAKPGWYVVDPVKVKTALVGLNSTGKRRNTRPPGHRLYIAKIVRARISSDRKTHVYGVTKLGTYFNLAYLNRSQDQG